VGRSRRPIAIAVAAALALAACGSAAVTPASPTAAPSIAGSASIPSVSPSPSPSPTPEASAPSASPASSGPEILDSKVYPYSLTVPAGSLRLAWIPAQRPWNGEEAINILGSPVVDKTGIADGGLIIFGAAAPDGLDAFFQLHAANGSRYHGCGKPTGKRTVTINGVQAIAFSQSCLQQQTRAEISIVHDGFGLGIFVSTAPGAESAAIDHLITLLAGLTWRPA
jgi:hypothetical protein